MSLVDERLRGDRTFAAMDFPTRNLYRSAIEQLARGSALTELEVTELALRTAQAAAAQAHDAAHAERVGDTGYHLIAEGRRALEIAIGFRVRPRLRLARFNMRLVSPVTSAKSPASPRSCSR